MVMFLVWAVVVVAVIAGLWKVFVKAGKPGWAAIVPIYNFIVMLEIVGKPIWWIVLMLIPVVNLVVAIIVSIALAEKFGKSAAYGIGIALLGFIFIPMLGFGDARYQG
ncbi:MAG: signal peptidase I [Acidobacteria bacterium]|nr:signal peptidase I [Acidobacteriota bacterium]